MQSSWTRNLKKWNRTNYFFTTEKLLLNILVAITLRAFQKSAKIYLLARVPEPRGQSGQLYPYGDIVIIF